MHIILQNCRTSYAQIHSPALVHTKMTSDSSDVHQLQQILIMTIVRYIVTKYKENTLPWELVVDRYFADTLT